MGHPWGAAVVGIVIGAGSDLPEAPGAGRDWIAVDLALRSALSASGPCWPAWKSGWRFPRMLSSECVARILAGDPDAGAGEGDAALV